MSTDAIDDPPPGSRRNDHPTSIAAEQIVRARSGTARLMLLERFAAALVDGRDGLTADEAAEACGLLGGCYWKRVSELRLGGLIAPTGTTRTGIRAAEQMVCAITVDGAVALGRRAGR